MATIATITTQSQSEYCNRTDIIGNATASPSRALRVPSTSTTLTPSATTGHYMANISLVSKLAQPTQRTQRQNGNSRRRRQYHHPTCLAVSLVLLLLEMNAMNSINTVSAWTIRNLRRHSGRASLSPLASFIASIHSRQQDHQYHGPTPSLPTCHFSNQNTGNSGGRNINSVTSLCMSSKSSSRRSISNKRNKAQSTQSNPPKQSTEPTNKTNKTSDKPKHPKSKSKTPNKSKPKSNTGRLRLLPPLQPSNEILSRSLRITYQTIKDDTSIANIRRRTQKRGAQTIDFLTQQLCAPLRTTVDAYKREFRIMHPFEKVVMELTIQSRVKKDGVSLVSLLEEVHEGRKEVLQLSKDWIAKIKNAPTAREAYEFTEEAKENVGQVYMDLIGGGSTEGGGKGCWDKLRELQRSLRNVPIVRLDCPAVVLVGAPNVGKSSIVRAISSGTPEVNNYPFTTRGMTLGHVQVFWESDQDVSTGNVAGVSIPSEQQIIQENLLRRGIKTRKMKEQEAAMEFDRMIDEERLDVGDGGSDGSEGVGKEGNESSHTPQSPAKSPSPMKTKISFPISQLCQIMDSPGLLYRDPTEERNEMEELTLAAMVHLPTAVMFVMDLSGGAGDKCSSVEDQLMIRRQVRARFPRRPWIDVISKVDLGVVDGAKERFEQILKEEHGKNGQNNDDNDDLPYIELSIKEGQGVDELRQEVMRMLGEVRVVLDAMAAVDERSARPVSQR